MRSRTLEKQLGFEVLEQKRVLAANVLATVVSGVNLKITGDADNSATNDFLQLTDGDPGELVLNGVFGTEFDVDEDGDGNADHTLKSTFDFTGITGYVHAELKDGDDLFRVEGATLHGDLIIDLGGSDLILPDVDDANILDSTVAGSVQILQSDTLGSTTIIDGSEIDGDLSIFGGASRDLVDFGSNGANSLHGEVVITLGDNPGGSDRDEIQLQNTAFDKDLFIAIGDSGETLIVGFGEVDVARDLILQGGGGEVSLDVTDLDIGDDLRFVGGGGGISILGSDLSVGDDFNVAASSGAISIEDSALNIGDDLIVDSDDNGIDFFASGLEVGDDAIVVGGSDRDVVSIDGLIVADDLHILVRGGNDEVFIDATGVGGSALIALGYGEDELVIDGFNDQYGLIGYGLTVLGHGTNDIEITGAVTSHFINVITANGNDLVDINGSMTYSALIETGAGGDTLTIADSTFDYLFALLGSGDDVVTLDGVIVNRFAFLSGGGGEDDLVDIDADSDINLLLYFGFEDVEI